MESDHASIFHVVLMDGTFASLAEGQGSSITRIHAMLSGRLGPLQGKVNLHYAPGQQWAAWRTLPLLISVQTVEQNIRNAYAWLARTWQPGEPLFLFGYSRGGMGICALAEMIDRIGLLRREEASDQNLLCAWNSYRYDGGPIAAHMRHDHVPIRMVGLLDTVMSLPFSDSAGDGFDYSKGRLAGNVARGVHALALDETRHAFAPVLWTEGRQDQRIEQLWFRGAHPDIGGQLLGHEAARPLANLPLVWLLSRAAEDGLPLPENWQDQHPCDPDAPRLGSWHRWGKAFLRRSARKVGLATGEALHPSVPLPYAGPAHLVGALATAAPERQRFRLRLPGDGGTDHSAHA
ncbi:DUF2235 domain-containing protein [Paracoccus litorisediminis]|uniref:DUF2235 domain-containing protein n=2 Tax=Paracoccus litorisediminis TaxID=2006130 RepID=A0A844HLQ1_9RHOB|nr:DUF2235 domain-containing protein [Paracoccus litorisediminis]